MQYLPSKAMTICFYPRHLEIQKFITIITNPQQRSVWSFMKSTVV